MAMLMATSAWAETKHLKCAIEDEEVVKEERVEVLIEIAFDLELQKFEINLESTENEVYDIDPGNLTVFPTFLSFSFIATRIVEGIVKNQDLLILELNRKNLMGKLYDTPEKEYEPGYIYTQRRTIIEPFKCQLVRVTKNQI